MNDVGPEFSDYMPHACIHTQIGSAPLSKMPDWNMAAFKQRLQTIGESIIERNDTNLEAGWI
jgi:hypothetical protein